MSARPLAIAALTCLALACHGDGGPPPEPAAQPEPAAETEPAVSPEEVEPIRTDQYVLVHLLTGPRADELSPEEISTATSGHFANMSRLGDEGLLLVAGPLFEPRADPAHRGIFVFDLASVEEALAQAASDPAVQAGVFELRAQPLRSDADLRALYARHLELTEEFDGDMQQTLRAYVLASAPEPELAAELMAPLADEGRVLFSARIGDPEDERALFALDASTAEEARELIAFADPNAELEWNLSPWFATKAVEELSAGD